MSLEGSVKLEPEWESESEAGTAPLFYAVKEELDLGPELLQPPDVVYALQDIVKTEPKAHVQAGPSLTCSVVLEPMLVDLQSRTCTIGLQTYNFQLHHENQESQEISLEEYDIKEEVKTEKEENENTSHQDISSNAHIREISSIKLASSTKVDRLGPEQNTVYEFVTQSINDCKFCGDTFDTQLLLQEHEKSQHGVKYFTCSTFTENGNLKVELNTENKLYECQTTFATSSNLGDHLGTHTGENNEAALAALYEDHVVKQELVLGPELLQKPSVVYTPPGQICLPAAQKTKSAKTRIPKVPIVAKKAKSSEKIAKHNSTEMNQGPFAASQDDLPWNTGLQEATPEKPATSSSSSEVNTLTAETNFKCEKCGKGFNIKSDLEKHLNTHMLMEASTSRKASKFTCKSCNCTFDTKLLLQGHEKSRHGVKYFACDQCEYATKHARDLQCHLRTHTGEKPFKCSQCSSAFSNAGHLQRHLGTHTDEKPFKCSQCSSAFSHSSYLQSHLRTHTGEKRFKCMQCSSTFTQRHSLKCHLRTHTGDKPFKCSQCSSAFSRSNSFRDHLRTHTGEKPFKCSQCSSAFVSNHGLRVHLRTHTGEKPFECNICDYKTTRANDLKRHLMSRHSGQKPFGCDACSYRAATRGILSTHMKRHHKLA